MSMEPLEQSRGQIDVCNKPRSKLKHSRTAAPIELRRVNIDVTIVHLLRATSYRSTEFNELLPSLPPICNLLDENFFN
jgi:hypothetical protein